MNAPLCLPPELACVPNRVLKEFLLQYSRVLVGQVAPAVPDALVDGFVDALLTTAAANSQHSTGPDEVALVFKHDCRFSGCHIDDCQLCRNNPNKVCEANDVFDRQYWVRDDGKGGQVLRARCGADVGLQLLHRATGSALLLPDVALRLYIVSGQSSSPIGLSEPAGGLYAGDDDHALFTAAGHTPDADGGVPLDVTQEDGVARLPELQFLNKNSKFKSGGRTFKAFKLLARAVRVDPATRRTVEVLAQVESGTFKVTTKKGYDGCRKAEYLYAHQAITDKTFASLGETTISNLKATFEGVETVEDLMKLVQAAERQPELQAQLRDTLNMSRDTDKWRKLRTMLAQKVVWDDSLLRLFVLPSATRPLGLLYRATRGQVELDAPLAGFVMHAPEATGRLRALDMGDRALAGFGRHLEALKRLAAAYWSFARHPGWALVVDPPKWESSTVAEVNEVFAEVLGVGDPVAAAEMHLASLAAAQSPQLAGAATAESLLTLGTPAHSSGNHSTGVVAAAAAAAAAGGGGLMLAGSTAASAGIWQTQDALGLAGAGSMGGLMQGGYAAPMTAGSMAAPGQLGIAGHMLGSMPLPGGVVGAPSGVMMVAPPPLPTAAAAGGGQGVSPFAAPPLSSMHASQRTASNATEHTSDTSGASMGGQGSRAVSRGAQSGQLQQQPPPGQQQQQVGSQQATPLLSAQSLMLQQAIAEGWPAPQLKAVLDNMSDHELQQLVDLRGAADAAAAAGRAQTLPAAVNAAGGGGLPAAQQLQGFGSNLTQPCSSTGQLQQGGTAASAVAAGRAGGDTGVSAAAALAALFADAAADDPAALRNMSDVQMAVDQGLLPLDSFTAADPSQWGDLLENLRGISSASGNPPGSAPTSGPLPRLGGSSMSTDWIPEFLGRFGSGRSEVDVVAAAAAAVAAAAADAGGDQQQQQQDQDAAGASNKGAAGGGRKGNKRERSTTGQRPTAQQLEQMQALAAGDPAGLRSLSKAQGHFDSFNRHFPVARHCSKTEGGVHEGTQVAHPWAPGLKLDGTGVDHAAGITDHPQEQEQGASPATQTEAGAAAVASLVGQRRQGEQEQAAAGGAGLAAEPEDSQRSATGLRAILEMAAGQEEGDAAAAAAAAAACDDDPFATAALQPMAPPPSVVQVPGQQGGLRDSSSLRHSSGTHGWISSLFRRSSSFSSKSGSGVLASGASGSGGSHSSKDAATTPATTPATTVAAAAAQP